MPADWLDLYTPEQREFTLLQVATMSDNQVRDMVSMYKTLQQASQNRLKEMNLSADLLKKMPLNAHKDILDAIQTGTLEFYKNKELHDTVHMITLQRD